MPKRTSQIKTWLFYIIMLMVFSVFTYFIMTKGGEQYADNHATHIHPTMENASGYELFKLSIFQNLAEPASMLLLQILSILIASRFFGYLFKKMGQPTVIGEILAGILLGPSLFGYYFPDAFHFLFAPSTLGSLSVLSQIGLILFMFIIGMELDVTQLKDRMGVTYVISHASILFPYLLGMGLAYLVYQEFAAGYTDYLSFALFIGISMSITAFPVLARIIQEKGLTKTHLGTIAIASAANDDVTAWCVLAAVIAITKTGSFISSIYTIGFAVLYVVIMLAVIRPFLKQVGKIYSNSEVLNKSIIAFLLLILIISAFITQVIGIHALFGAFLAGVVMPQLPDFRRLVVEKIEDVSVTLLLPLFFVFTGLRTEIGLLNTTHLWIICGVFIGVAIVGKFVGGAFSARLLGESWKDSLSLGILMNTRGLMELIVLNIGYEMHILPPPIFVMLVIMALITTFMTTPVLSLINKLFPNKNLREEYIRQQAQGVFKVMVALGNPENGRNLVNVAKTLLDGAKNSLWVTAMHITPGTDTNPIYGEQYASESFVGIKTEADRLEIPLTTEYKVTDNIELGIIKNVNQNNYDFLLVGAGVSLSGIPFLEESNWFKKIKWLNHIINRISSKQTLFYPGSLIRDKTKYFIENSNCSVGVFVNRGYVSITNTVILLNFEEDEFLLRYARRLMRNSPHVTVQILDLNRLIFSSERIREGIHKLKLEFPDNVKVNKLTRYTSSVLVRYSFMLISYPTWNELSLSDKGELENIPSTVIINKKPSRFRGASSMGKPNYSNINNSTKSDNVDYTKPIDPFSSKI